MEREVGGGIGMGNTCKPLAVSFQCMTKSTTNKKKKKKRKGVYSDSISRVAAVSTGSVVQIPLSQTSRRLGGHRAIEENLGAPIGLKCWPSPSTTRAIPVACCAEATAEIIMTSSL